MTLDLNYHKDYDTLNRKHAVDWEIREVINGTGTGTKHIDVTGFHTIFMPLNKGAISFDFTGTTDINRDGDANGLPFASIYANVFIPIPTKIGGVSVEGKTIYANLAMYLTRNIWLM